MKNETTKTGQTVKARGLYSSDCCNNEQIFDAGDNFTRCLKCMSLCDWEMDQELVSIEEFEGTDAIAA